MSKLNIFKFIYKYIHDLPSQIKDIIILVLFFIIIGIFGFKSIDRYLHIPNSELQSDMELYTFEHSSEINDCLQYIQESDTCISRVILCTYHNNKKSLQGLEYIYCDFTSQSSGKPGHSDYKRLFYQLNYIYYSDELSYIQKSGGYIMDSYQLQRDFPKLYQDIFQNIKFRQIGMYSIQGQKFPKGLLIVIYDKYNPNHKDNYLKSISVSIQKLSNVIDIQNND